MVLTRRRWRQALSRGVAAAVEHRTALASLDVATVVDAGANRGQFSLFAREAFPQARIYAIEPLPEAGKVFRRVFAGDERVRLFARALAREVGKRTLHVARRDDSSSLLPIGGWQQAVFAGTDPVGRVTVQAAPLMDLLPAEAIQPPALLKLDVQGCELEVLEGCGDLLDRFAYVYCECSEVELYAGQALRPEIEGFLAGHGFMPVGRSNVFVDRRLGPVQADVLFARVEGVQTDNASFAIAATS